MKFLFNNSIRYILRSKISIILLASIIFISSCLFSLLGSMSSSMQDSYSTLNKQSLSQNIVIDENYKSYENSYIYNCSVEGEKYLYSLNFNEDVKPLISDKFNNKQIIVANPLSQKCYKEYILDKNTSEINSDTILNNSIKPYHESAISQIESFVKQAVEESYLNAIKESKFISKQDSIVKTDSITVKSQTVNLDGENKDYLYKAVYKNNIVNNDKLQEIYKYDGDSFSQTMDINRIINEENYYKKYMRFLNLEGVADDEEIEESSAISIDFIKSNMQFVNKRTDYSLAATRTISVLGNNIPKSAGVYDPTAVEIIVSPTYSEKNNLVPVKKSELYKQKYFTKTGIFKSDIFASDFPKSVLRLGKISFAVIGIGSTSDFSYPIIDSANISVDTDNQAIVFMNKASFSRAYDSNRESSRERYISILSKSDNLKGVVQSLNIISENYMSWPSNIKAAKISKNNIDNINLSNYREATLNSIKYSISSMTIYSSIFLAILCGFIIYVIVKRKISESKKSLSILQANGYSKSSIAFSMTTISLFIGILPNMLGYISGLILQRYMFSVFSSYWTLPYYYQGFSIITMFLIILIPFIFISLVSYFGSLVTLRGRLIDNINLNTEKPNAFSNYFSKAFFFLPIKPRFSLLLFSKNIVKMLIITAAFATSTSTSVIAFSIFGKFDEAKDRTDSVNKYKYRVDLLTPTIEGGQYSALFSTPYPQWKVDNNINPIKNYPTLNYKNSNKSFIGYNSRQELINNQEYDNFEKGDSSKIWHNSYFAIPEIKGGDTPGFNSSYEKNINYLNHKIQFEPFLKISIAGIAPWESAKNQIPENFRLLLEENSKYFYDSEEEIDNLVKDIREKGYITKFKTDFSVNKSFQDSVETFQSDVKNISKALSLDNNNSIYSSYTLEERQRFLDEINSDLFSISENNYWIDSNIGKDEYPVIGIKLPKDYSYEEFNKIIEILNEYLESKGINYRYGSVKDKIIQAVPNFFAYNQVIINKEDELYTHLNLASDKFSSNISVTGIDVNSRNIILSNQQKEILKSYDKIEEYNPLNDNNYLPVFINHFISEKNSLKKGDVFQANLNNSMYRYLDSSKTVLKLKVIDIIDTYNKNQIITSKDLASKVISWRKNQNYSNTEMTVSNNSIDDNGCSSFFADFETALNTNEKILCNKNNSYKYIFNGVFSNSEQPSILNNLHLYSESGIYPGVESLSPNVINSPLFSEDNLATKRTIDKFVNNHNIDKNMSWNEKKNLYIKTYSRNIYSSLLTSGVDVKSVSSYSFDNSAKLVSTNVWIILSVVLSISIGFSIIMGINIVDENKKNISILKTIGYKNNEITNMIMGSYAAPIISGLILSIPTTIFIIGVIKTLIIAFGSITIPIPLVGLGLLYGLILSLGSLSLTMYIKIKSSISSDSIKALKA